MNRDGVSPGVEAYVGLGSNLGDRRALLEAAIGDIAAIEATQLLACSAIYESPAYEADGGAYLNAVVRVRTALDAATLLERLQAVERHHGRERPYRNAPRTLDLDLLLYGDERHDGATLTVPHPRLHERAFVLVPLAELAPGLVVPGRGPLAGLLPAVSGQPLARLEGTQSSAMEPPRPGLGQRWHHIAIEGAIGAGKTTLAKRLAAHLGADLLLEQPAENPFLGRFYADMPGYAFQTQLFFLFERYEQLHSLAQPSILANGVVSDFMFAKDAIFARLTLNDDELRLYFQMHAPVAAQLREPDLVIWLHAPPTVLKERVHERGIAMEQGIELGYLERLSAAYARFFQSYDSAPVLAIDTSSCNPAENDSDLDAVLLRIAVLSD